MTTVIEQCKYIFTETELQEFAESMARKVAEMELLEDQKKEVAQQFKSKLDGLQNEIKRLAKYVRNRYDYRETECELLFDYEDNEVRYIRMDTGEVHRVRDMTAAEKQMKLPGEDG
jgi:hypothetical protein